MIPFNMDAVNFLIRVVFKNKNMVTVKVLVVVFDACKIFRLRTPYCYLAAHVSVCIKYSRVNGIVEVGKTVYQSTPKSFAEFANFSGGSCENPSPLVPRLQESISTIHSNFRTFVLFGQAVLV